MKDKYYTPEIEEFHVGFEFEYEYWDILRGVNYDWHEEVYYQMSQTKEPKKGGHTLWSIDSLSNAIKEESIRVKHLDKEDIESLGFKEFLGQEYYSLGQGDNQIRIEDKFLDIVDHLRACEPQHPAFFIFNNEKYIIEIHPEDEPEFPDDLEITFYNKDLRK